LTERKNLLYGELLKNMSPQDLDPAVRKTMDLLKARGIKIAIGSSSKNAKLILQQIGLKDYFDAISDGTNISRSKPDPEVFIKASEYLGVEPQFCLVVEDSRAGVEAAVAANMDCAAMGDAAGAGMATYDLECFSDLLCYVT
jgi:HAD superfamily hydrolase (TIGR01509 family)